MSDISGSFSAGGGEDDTNPWAVDAALSAPSDSYTAPIYRDGDVVLNDSMVLSNANSVGTTPDILFDTQGLVTSESNQFYHSRTGVHRFLGGNTGGISGAASLVTITQAGELDFHQYGDGTFEDTNESYFLTVDTAGNVGERPKRLPNPGDPTITLGGSGGTLLQTAILDRWSDVQSYGYRVRCRVNMVVGVGWAYLIVPTKAGFQQPEISAVGTYRTTSNAPQNDNAGGTGSSGATPFGPYMGAEAHHWSSTNRIYQGIYRRDNAFTTYIEFTVVYKRN